MIVTQAPELDDTLKIVTPWWDITAKYLVAAIMAIALTTIALQATEDGLICIPAIDCSDTLVKNQSSTDKVLVCQSLTPNRSKKTVLTKMDDRRHYDYVDSECFQNLNWFTKFYPFLMFGEAVLLLVCDMLWMKLPKTTSALNNFVALANEAYSSSGTLADTLQTEEKEENKNEEAAANTTGNDEHGSDNTIQLLLLNQQEHARKNSTIVSKSDVIKLKTLYNKAEHLLDKYNAKSDLIYCYIVRAFFQALICSVSLGVNSFCLVCLSYTIHIKCCLNEVFVTKYEHFKCSRPIAPYFQIALISSLFPLAIYLATSIYAICRMRNWCGWSHSLSQKYCDEGKIKFEGDLAFLFHLLEQYDELYSRRFSVFYSVKAKNHLSEIYNKRIHEKDH